VAYDFLPILIPRQLNVNHNVKPPWAQKCSIERVGPARAPDDENTTSPAPYPVHFVQERREHTLLDG
jgi:hypothetical protein